MKTIIPKILVAYDGSACSKAALKDIQHAGIGPAANVRVMTVSDPWMPPIESLSVASDVIFAGGFAAAREQVQDALKNAKALAEEGVALLRKDFPEWKVTAFTAVDSPAQGLLLMAEKWKPALIALGSQGHGALGRMLLGSVSHKVLTHAVCNVRVARLSSGRATTSRVLLAVDGSRDAEAMIKNVANRAWEKDTEFRVIIVLDYRLSLIQNFQTSRGKKRLREDLSKGTLPQRIAEQAEVILAERGLKVTSALREGDPREEIIREIKRFKATSLFVGSRGLHAVQRFFLGSVSAALAEHAPCTVEIVRR